MTFSRKKMPLKIARPLLPPTLIALALLSLGARAEAATINVTDSSDQDELAGVTTCSLRAAIRAANENRRVNGCQAGESAWSDSIYVGARTINLTAGLEITAGDVSIYGAGYERTILDGQSRGIHPFRVVSGSTFVQGLTLQNVAGTGFKNEAPAMLQLDHTRLRNIGQSVLSGRGCVLNLGSLYLTNSELQGCQGFRGSAIANASGANAYLNGVTIRDAQGETGTVLNNGFFSAYNSTFSNNSVTVRGAAVSNTSSTYLEGVTVAYNRSSQFRCNDANCGALATAGGTMEILGSVVAHNTLTAGPRGNCTAAAGSAITSLGFNVLGESSAVGCTVTPTPGKPDLPAADPLILPLGAAGGVGPVHTPAASSPLQNAIPGTESMCSFQDQRGITRRSDASGRCDIGAVERALALLVVGNPSAMTIGDQVIRGTLERLGFTVTDADDGATTASAAIGKGVVVVSETVTSDQVQAKFRDTDVGVVVMEPNIYDDMRMTNVTNGTHYGTIANQTQVNILRDGLVGHAAGYVGTVPVTVAGRTFVWGVGGYPQANINGSSTRGAIFQYHAFDQMFGGFQAPGRRVGFFATDVATPSLTTAGLRLLEEAIIQAAW